MNTFSIDWRRLRDASWWHWTLTIPLLVAHLEGVPGAIVMAIGLCAVMAAYYYTRLGRVRPFPVQIRLGYLILLVVGLLPTMHWIHDVQLAGSSLMVTVGYCPMARMLMLLPWNRNEPLSGPYIVHAFWRAARTGGLIVRTRELAATEDGEPAPGCSLATNG